jgi:predicted SAM-dependent methyltransferase
MILIKNLNSQYPFCKSFLLKIHRQLKSGKPQVFFHFLTSGHLIRWCRIRKWINRKGEKLLQIGGGRHLKVGEEWLNGDIIAGQIYLNAAKNLPFSDNSVDAIFTEHFFEHLSQREAIRFLDEACRILKPSGILRQSTPDLEKIILIYQDKNDVVSLAEVVERHIYHHRRNDSYASRSGCQLINDIFRLWGHKFIYDKSTLEKITVSAGFRKFRWVSFGKSEFESLENLERHADLEWMKEGLTMLYEAVK